MMPETPKKTMQEQETLKIRKTTNKDPLYKRLVEDNRFIFVCSLLLAFIMWCLVSVYASPEIERTISSIPVSIELNNTTQQLGLQIFGSTEYYVDVIVRGPKYQLSENMFTKDDIRVSANTAYVDSAGETQLNLRAEIIDASSDIEIVNISRNTVSVYFDTLKEASFTLEPDIRFPDGMDTVPDGYILDTPILSVSKATVSGPASEISKIKRVVARVENESSLTATTTTQAQIYMLGDNNISPNYCTCSVDDVTVTMPVKKIVTLPVGVSFANAPIGYLNAPLSQSVSPEKVTVALNTELADSTEVLSIGTIDFADIDAKVNTFTFNTADISDVKFIDHDIEEITVKIDASEMSKKVFTTTLSAVSTANAASLPEGSSVEYDFSKPFDVTVVGPEESLASLSASGIYAEVDYSDIEPQNGVQRVKISFYVKSLTDCWCIGNYSIHADISVPSQVRTVD